MSDLFSKDYLKELLSSNGLDDALKNTAKTGLESIADKVAEGESTGSSVADKILNSGDGIVGTIAQDALSTASEEGLSAVKDNLFSTEYLKDVLKNEYRYERVSKKDKDKLAPPTKDALPQASAPKKVSSPTPSAAEKATPPPPAKGARPVANVAPPTPSAAEKVTPPPPAKDARPVANVATNVAVPPVKKPPREAPLPSSKEKVIEHKEESKTPQSDSFSEEDDEDSSAFVKRIIWLLIILIVAACLVGADSCSDLNSRQSGKTTSYTLYKGI